jgi:hypothetical protein
MLNNDSIPDTAEEPRWIRFPVNGTTASASAGRLTLTSAVNTEIDFYRRDSVRSTTPAYIEAMFSSTSTSARPAQLLAFDDGTKSIGLGVANNRVWFADSSHTFIAGGPQFTALTTTAMNTYQLRKYAADSVIFLVNGIRGGGLPYASLPSTAVPTVAPIQVFGQRSLVGTVTSVWEYVLYEIGFVPPYP